VQGGFAVDANLPDCGCTRAEVDHTLVLTFYKLVLTCRQHLQQIYFLNSANLLVLSDITDYYLKVVLTDGAKYIADEAGCYLLMDLYPSH
jgi:hypothetical protein